MGAHPNWTILRAALWTRSKGRCEITGAPLDPDTFDAHHRRNKGMGGTVREDRDWLSNLLALDPAVHNGGPRSVHARRAWSQQRGYLLPKNTTWASMVPCLILGRFWLMLGDDGQYYPSPCGGLLPPVSNTLD